jgi:hypothetical protein
LYRQRIEVSADIETTLRNASTSGDLRNYLQQKHNWNDTTVELVDWHIHGQALKSLNSNQRKTITQVIHGWLPLNGHPGMHLQNNNLTCPECHIERETQYHFFNCKQNQDTWKNALQTNGISKCDLTSTTNTSKEYLHHILHCALTRKDNDDDDIEIVTTPTRFQKLIREQKLIGWNQILNGRWTTEWVHQFESLTPHQGEKLAIAAITSIWHAILSLWYKRCKTQHGEMPLNQIRQRTQLIPVVEALYHAKQKLDTIDQQVLKQPITSTLSLPVARLKD